ncbi:MAG: hypothetical protein LBJ09_02875 [Clostridiales bacterium]|jgi:hypothetical protein|nr:hypothetical protein [Clostridiales bacterium]
MFFWIGIHSCDIKTKYVSDRNIETEYDSCEYIETEYIRYYKFCFKNIEKILDTRCKNHLEKLELDKNFSNKISSDFTSSEKDERKRIDVDLCKVNIKKDQIFWLNKFTKNLLGIDSNLQEQKAI